jgi:hypothetical protein
MWTAATLNSGLATQYGFGWEVRQQRGHRVITHAGMTGTEYSRFPDDALTVIVLTNLGLRLDADRVNPWGITFGVAGHYVPAVMPSTPVPTPPREAIPTNVVGASDTPGIAAGAVLQPDTVRPSSGATPTPRSAAVPDR